MSSVHLYLDVWSSSVNPYWSLIKAPKNSTVIESCFCVSGGPQQGVHRGAGVAGGKWQGPSECPPERRPATCGRAAPQEVLTLLISNWLAVASGHFYVSFLPLVCAKAWEGLCLLHQCTITMLIRSKECWNTYSVITSCCWPPWYFKEYMFIPLYPKNQIIIKRLWP